MIPFEQINQNANLLLMRIEVALRQCLSISMKEELGKKWERQIAPDLLRKIRESQKEENRPQFGFVRLGPLYYLTLGELLTLLRQKHGKTVASMFGGEKFLGQIENILPVRNSVGHNRSASQVGLLAIQALYAQMETVLTQDGLRKLLKSPDVGLQPGEFAAEALPQFAKALSQIDLLPPLFELTAPFEKATEQYWWADDDLAGFKREIVESSVAALEGYNCIGSGVGSTGLRHRFCEQRALAKTIQSAISELNGITK